MSEVQDPDSPSARQPNRDLPAFEIAALAAVAAAMIAAAWRGWWPLSLTEVLGFTTGGACVWLVVREHVWNWPVGLANNVFFFVLFFQARLFGDMALQVVFFGLGIYGWVHWLFGGDQRASLPISRTSSREWMVIAAGLPFGTWALREVLVAVQGAAPFWDSLTTMLSLVAQYLLGQKRLENWLFWIVADIIYIPLYFTRALPLTAGLYGVFLIMCLFGVRSWHRHWKAQQHPGPALS